MGYVKHMYKNGNMYILDYQHVGLSVIVDNIKTFFENIYKFNSSYVSTYDKFVAGLQKIPVNSENIKHIVLFGNEGPRLPSLLIDPQQIEPDENVSNLFFNFSKFNNIYGSINKVEVLRTDKFVIRLGLSYIKLNVNAQAFLRSVYEKLDLDMKVYQLFTGVNRVTEQFTNIYYIPLPSSMYDDMKLMDPTVEDKVLKLYFDHIGKELPFVIYNYTPRLTLQSISDESEKYGNELIPYFKSSYQILAEGYVPSMMFLEVNYTVGSMLFPISTGSEESYLLVDSYMLFKILTELFPDDIRTLANYLSSLLLNLGIITQDELSSILTQFGSNGPMLLLQLFKTLLNLSYDDLEFLTELLTVDIDKLIWMYNNEYEVSKIIDSKLRNIGCTIESSISDLQFDELVMVYRRCSSLLDSDSKKMFLAYVFLRFLEQVTQLTGSKFTTLNLLTILSSKLIHFQENRNELLNFSSELQELVIPVSKSISLLQSCKGLKKMKNVVISGDVEIGQYYQVNVSQLFNLNTDGAANIIALGVSYEYDNTEKILKIYGPLRKGSVVTVIQL